MNNKKNKKTRGDPSFRILRILLLILLVLAAARMLNKEIRAVAHEVAEEWAVSN